MTDDPVLAAERAAEQRHVDRVYARVAVVAARTADLDAEGHGRGHIDHEGGVKEEHYRGLYERDVLVHAAARRARQLDAEHEGLVFGRLDYTTGEVRYVGRLGLVDDEQRRMLVDWRAPGAVDFYRSTAVEPRGVVRRRVLSCAAERVVHLSDDLLDAAAAPPGMPVVGDGALLAAVSRARGDHMHDIVATIQDEQHRAIRAPRSGATIITGGPGTGKTVVALHRAAYLLFQERNRFEAGGVLVVGPSPAFIAYIARVLPALGEDSVTLAPVGELVDGVEVSRPDPPAAGELKGSPRMLPVLRRAYSDVDDEAPAGLRLYHRDRVLRVDRAGLAALRRDAFRTAPTYRAARVEAGRRLLDELWRQARTDATGRLDRDSFDDHVVDRPEFRRFFAAWWPRLTAEAVFDRLRDPARLPRYAEAVLTPTEVDLLLRSWPAGGGWSAADAALVDELRAIGGAAVPTYAHIVVDEAQDLSPMQWRMVGRRGDGASWTVVGDLAQSSWPDPAQARAAMLATLPAPRHEFRLTTNYRNAAEVADLARSLITAELPDADVPTAVRRTGHLPEHVVVAAARTGPAVRAAVERLAGAVGGTIGVIARAGEPAVRSVIPGGRVRVVTPLEAKGLEYDAVVVVEPDRILAGSPAGARTLYVALTRATQRLITVGSTRHWLDRHGGTA